MRKRLLERDPLTRTEKWFHWDATGDNYVIESKHDDSPIVELNKAEYAQIDERAPWGDIAKIGSIPAWVLFAYFDKDGWCRDDQAVLKFLADRDNLDFRTRPGRLI